MEVGAVEIIIIDTKNTKITSIHTGLAGELEFTDKLGDWYGAEDDDELDEQEELVNTEERVQEALQGLHAVDGEITVTGLPMDIEAMLRSMLFFLDEFRDTVVPTYNFCHQVCPNEQSGECTMLLPKLKVQYTQLHTLPSAICGERWFRLSW